MKEERYLYQDRMLIVREYNGQLIFEFEHYERDFDREAAESSGGEGPEKMACDNEPQY